MSRFRFPRYQGSSAVTVAELHDRAMDELVRQYRAHVDSAGSEGDGGASARPSASPNTPEKNK